MGYAIDVELQKMAARMGRPLPSKPHARFVHGYEVPLWSGPLVRWLLPRAGALPVYHVKFDQTSVARLRFAYRDGPYPIALAPEGQISYRSETLPRMERGALRLGFWCAEDLRRAGRGERVLILPISVHYAFDEGGIRRLERLVAETEAAAGIAAPKGATFGAAAGADAGAALGAAPAAARSALKARLVALDARLIELAEGYYGIAHRGADSPPRDARLDAVLEEALSRAEAMLGLDPEGDRIARVYRIRQEGWDRERPASLPEGGALARRLADRAAGEAWYAMRHMELVDLCHYLDSAYIEGGGPSPGIASFGRLVETACSLADLASRLLGGDISGRPSPLRKKATLIVAQPIDMTARYADYLKDRKGSIEAAARDLEGTFRSCIEEHLHGRKD
ncbi:MAG: hypothetical protein Q8M76_14440 [Spirochaetaceae bacterium]|nr:hypothetical protein [Spirochaetaceae bacterium]